MPRPLPDPIARAVRPFFARVLELAAEGGGAPSDYVLVVGKYDAAECRLLARAASAEIDALAKTPARRGKLERFLAAPCDPRDLLVLVSAGDHVDGYRVRVPTRPAREGDDPANHDLTAHTQRWAHASYEALKDAGESPSDYIVYVRWPPPEGEPVAPKVLLRSEAPDKLRALRGTKKYEQIVASLEDTRDDVLLVVDVAGQEDVVIARRGAVDAPPEVGSE